MSKLEIVKSILECIAVFILPLIFLLHPCIRDLWRCSRKRWAIAIITCYFGITCIVQVTTFNQYHYPQANEKFPFTRWAMFAGFTTKSYNVTLFDWYGLTESGERIHVNPALLYVTPNAVVHFTKTKALASALTSTDTERSTFAIAGLNAYARGLLARHNHLPNRVRLVAIELRKRQIAIDSSASKELASDNPHGRIIYTYRDSGK
jgi:hypothetical protein